MSEENDLVQRVDALEVQGRDMRSQLAAVRADAAAARTLASGADHDVAEVRAELRAHTSALNALRETQLEQGRTLSQHSQILGEHSQILGEHGRVLNTVQVGVERIVELLTEPPAR